MKWGEQLGRKNGELDFLRLLGRQGDLEVVTTVWKKSHHSLDPPSNCSLISALLFFFLLSRALAILLLLVICCFGPLPGTSLPQADLHQNTAELYLAMVQVGVLSHL